VEDRSADPGHGHDAVGRARWSRAHGEADGEWWEEGKCPPNFGTHTNPKIIMHNKAS
jgi:hypothetical protein